MKAFLHDPNLHKKIFAVFVVCFLLSSAQGFSQAGTLDSSFGVNGKVTTELVDTSLYPAALAIQADGKIVVIGTAHINNPFHENFIVIRYAANGNLDSSFGINGVVTTDFDQQKFGSSSSNAILIQPDGKILVAGSVISSDFDFESFALVRYKTNGELDSTFGKNGASVSFARSAIEGSEITALALQKNGKILAAGKSNGYSVARYKSNGTIDATFGVNGMLRNTDTTCYDVNEMFVQADGKIVTGCTRTYIQGPSDFQLNRLLPNGSFDSTFGNNGFVYTDFQGASDYLGCITLLPNGNILAAGTSDVYPDGQIAISTYNPDGSLDSSFGTNGKMISAFDEVSPGANKILVQDDGKLIVAGSILVRLNSDGTPDATFGTAGKAVNFLGAKDAVLQTDAKVVSLNTPNFSLQRFKGSSVTASIQKNLTTFEGNSGTTPANFKIVLNEASTKRVTVNYATFDGTAKAGQDYVATSGTLIFNPGTTTKRVTINVIGDNVVEKNERFSLQLSNPSNAMLGTPSTATCTIKNDDPSFAIASSGEEDAKINNIKLYPNPAKDVLQIGGLKKNTTTIISVIDMQGKVMMKTTTSNASSSINVKQLVAGTYFVKIESANANTTLKFLKE